MPRWLKTPVLLLIAVDEFGRGAILSTVRSSKCIEWSLVVIEGTHRPTVWRVGGKMALLTETLISNRASWCHPLK
jgi:hypothetical protein